MPRNAIFVAGAATLAQAASLPARLHIERRSGPRYPINLPSRLRLGDELFAGHASDLGPRGIGLQVLPGADTVQSLAEMLTDHDRGALELFPGEARLVTRVRILRYEPMGAAADLGLIIADEEEAGRLIRRLAAYGVLEPDWPR